MITDLWIENFKGIGKRQHIPLRPITLLFGANSAGKSTVLHALLYVREILANQNFNPTGNIAGVDSVSLGGFDNLVHSSVSDADCRAQVTIGVEFDVDCGSVQADAPVDFQYYMDMEFEHEYGSGELGEHLQESYEHFDEVEHATAEFTIGKDNHGRVECMRFALSFNGVQLMESGQTGNGDISGTLNLDHELLSKFRLFWVDAKTVETLRMKAATVALSSVAPSTLDSRLDKIYAAGIRGSGDTDQPITRTIRLEPDAPSLLVLPGQIFRDALLSHDHDRASVSQPVGTLDVLADGVIVSGTGADLEPLFVVSSKSESVAAELAEEFRKACRTPLRFGVSNLIWSAAVERPIPDLDTCNFFEWDGAGRSAAVEKHWQLVASEFLIRPHRDGLRHQDEEYATLLLEQLMRGSLHQLRSQLNSVCYVGPKRSTVPRELTTKNVGQLAEWGNGLAAWGWLLESSNEGLKQCSDWLGDKQFLGTEFRLNRTLYKEVPEQLLNAVAGASVELDQSAAAAQIQRLQTQGRVSLIDKESGNERHPQDVGEGITQVVPVIVSLVRSGWFSGAHICAFEQPELHLHPSLAARLGDLLVCGCLASPSRGCSLTETHSEHLVLRLLRRIRQTTDGGLPEHIPPIMPDDVCVLYVNTASDGTTIQRLRIDESGEFIDRWPHGFFREREEDLFG